MGTQKVTVTVQGGAIRVSPDPLLATIRDDVSWGCASSHRFTIEFEGASPFASKRLAHDAATQPQRPASKGRFKYTVSLESDPSVRLDPEVVVGDPPTDPHP